MFRGSMPHSSTRSQRGCARRFARHGIRNSHLLPIAPTGSISLLAGNLTSGIEPIFELRFRKRVLDHTGTPHIHDALDRAYSVWRSMHGDAAAPASLANAPRVTPREQVAMQAALQRFVDGAIAKTIRVPAGEPFEAFERVLDAYDWE
jgi:ribonucleoside-diphosphate reductase alpha chain